LRRWGEREWILLKLIVSVQEKGIMKCTE
jgi:hypothetical protein